VRQLRIFAVAAPLLLAFISTGCDSKPHVSFVDVEGSVTLNGNIVPGAEVTFYPVAPGSEALPYATGRTDEKGHYKLAVSPQQSGAAVGKTRAVVNWPARERTEDRGAQQKPPFDIPVRYSVASQTPLEVEVKAGGPNTIDLAMVAP
jgi:hypothetical protein